MEETSKNALPTGTCVKNTFLQFEEDIEEDPWLISATTARRQKTDSIVDRSSQSLRVELEENIRSTLESHLLTGLPSTNTQPSSILGSGQEALATDRSAIQIDDLGVDNRMMPVRSSALPTGLHVGLEATLPADLASTMSGFDGNGMPSPLFENAQDENELLTSPVSLTSLSAKPTMSSVKPLAFPGTMVGQGQESRQTTEDEPEPAPQCASSSTGGELPALCSALCQDNDIKNKESDDEADDIEDGMDATDAARVVIDPSVMKAREVAENGGGLSGCTTIMMRHIPCKYSQGKLMREINSSGFMGRYDFFYLPVDPRSRSNRGFAFINFTSVDFAEAFYRTFHAKQLRHFNSEKVLAIMPADLQGFENNAAHYTASRVLGRKRTSQNKPLFFRPLPEHLLVELDMGSNMTSLTNKPFVDTGSKGSTPLWIGASSSTRQVATFGASPAPQDFMASLPQSVPHVRPGVKVAHSLFGSDIQDVGLVGPSTATSQTSTLQPKFCPHCGAPIQPVFQFCPYCGGSLDFGEIQLPYSPSIAF